MKSATLTHCTALSLVPVCMCSMQSAVLTRCNVKLLVTVTTALFAVRLLPLLQQCLISGDPISTVAAALEEAKKGEVVLSVETLAILTGDVRGALLPSMNMRIEWARPEVYIYTIVIVYTLEYHIE
jgi:hypothetical protein